MNNRIININNKRGVIMAKKKSSKSKKTVKKKINTVKDKTKVQIKKYKEMARAELKKAKQKFVNQEKKVNRYINKNPKKAIAIAAGIGVALGAVAATIIRRKKKK